MTLGWLKHFDAVALAQLEPDLAADLQGRRCRVLERSADEKDVRVRSIGVAHVTEASIEVEPGHRANLEGLLDAASAGHGEGHAAKAL